MLAWRHSFAPDRMDPPPGESQTATTRNFAKQKPSCMSGGGKGFSANTYESDNQRGFRPGCSDFCLPKFQMPRSWTRVLETRACSQVYFCCIWTSFAVAAQESQSEGCFLLQREGGLRLFWLRYVQNTESWSLNIVLPFLLSLSPPPLLVTF